MSIPPTAVAVYCLCQECAGKFTVPDSIPSTVEVESGIRCSNVYCNKYAVESFLLTLIMTEKTG